LVPWSCERWYTPVSDRWVLALWKCAPPGEVGTNPTIEGVPGFDSLISTLVGSSPRWWIGTEVSQRPTSLVATNAMSVVLGASADKGAPEWVSADARRVWAVIG